MMSLTTAPLPGGRPSAAMVSPHRPAMARTADHPARPSRSQGAAGGLQCHRDGPSCDRNIGQDSGMSQTARQRAAASPNGARWFRAWECDCRRRRDRPRGRGVRVRHDPCADRRDGRPGAGKPCRRRAGGTVQGADAPARNAGDHPACAGVVGGPAQAGRLVPRRTHPGVRRAHRRGAGQERSCAAVRDYLDHVATGGYA